MKEAIKRARRLHRLCCKHADELLSEAQAILDRSGLTNVSYHLAALALEEVGKGSLLLAEVFRQRDTNWIIRRLDDHVFKLTWAIWSPLFGSGDVSYKQFQKTQQWASSIHRNRLDGMYVSRESTRLPSKVVSRKKAAALISFARTRLALERSAGAPLGPNEDWEWFIGAIEDPLRKKYIFTPGTLNKLNSLRGNAPEWVKWLRSEESSRIASEQAHSERELARKRPDDGARHKDKWSIQIRVFTPSHSIRPKPLNDWNKVIKFVNLRPASKNNELIITYVLPADVSVKSLWHVAWGYAREFVLALNIGAMGIFWWYQPHQSAQFYDRIDDLDAKDFHLDVKNIQFEAKWDGKVLSENLLARVSTAYSFIVSLRAFDVDHIFGRYIGGVTFFSKSDVHYDFSATSGHLFVASLWSAMELFGDWDGTEETRSASFDCVFTQVLDKAIVDELFSETMIFRTEAEASRHSLTVEMVLKCKAAMDVYMAIKLQDVDGAIKRVSERASLKRDKSSPTSD